MAAITQLLGWKLSLHGVPCEGGLTIVSGGGSLNRYPSGTPVALQRISGHRDGDATECPGNALYAQLPELRRRAAALAGPIVARGVVSLRPSAAAINYGADAVFTGTVIRPDATAGAGEAVALQKRGTGGTWVTVGRTTALVDGSWVVRVPWRRGGDVRAVSAGVTSKAIAVKVNPALTTRRASKRVSAGSSVGLSGRVRPAVPIAVLIEREGADGMFHRVRIIQATVRLTTWRAAIRLRRPGLYRLTARTGVTDGDVRGTPMYVRAVHWRLDGSFRLRRCRARAPRAPCPSRCGRSRRAAGRRLTQPKRYTSRCDGRLRGRRRRRAVAGPWLERRTSSRCWSLRARAAALPLGLTWPWVVAMPAREPAKAPMVVVTAAR